MSKSAAMTEIIDSPYRAWKIGKKYYCCHRWPTFFAYVIAVVLVQRIVEAADAIQTVAKKGLSSEKYFFLRNCYSFLGQIKAVFVSIFLIDLQNLTRWRLAKKVFLLLSKTQIVNKQLKM